VVPLVDVVETVVVGVDVEGDVVLVLVLVLELLVVGVLVECDVELGGVVADLVEGGAERDEPELELELPEPPLVSA
jgi:hypothetical protein